MAKDTYRVAAIIDPMTRDTLLRMYRPRLDFVHCFSITWAYGVPGDCRTFPQGVLDAVVIGRHETSQHEALIVRLSGHTNRPDGKMLSITLSVADGVQPAAASAIEPAAVFDVEKTAFPTRLKIVPAWHMRPTPLAALDLSRAA